MRLLLDTHTLLWWWAGGSELSPEARALLADPRNELLVSAASGWEVTTKHRLGKLGELFDAAPRFEELVDIHGLTRVPIDLAHGLRAGTYRAKHGDPFDRVLAAQSELMRAPLVTRDKAFAAFPCETRW